MLEHPVITLFFTHAACAAFGAIMMHHHTKRLVECIRASALTDAKRQFRNGIIVGEHMATKRAEVARR